jgi:hypothetical protein
VVVRDTERIGSANSRSTRVHAELVTAVDDAGADFIVAAVRVVLACRNGRAPLDDIIWVFSLEALSTETLSQVADCVWTTFLFRTEILSVFSGNSASFEWVSDKSKLTSAIVASLGVDALCVLPTHLVLALVNVSA